MFSFSLQGPSSPQNTETYTGLVATPGDMRGLPGLHLMAVNPKRNPGLEQAREWVEAMVPNWLVAVGESGFWGGGSR